MQTRRYLALAGAALAVLAAAVFVRQAPAGAARVEPNASTIEEGFAAAPVPLNLRGKNRNLVGLGSYLVNVHAACVGCHTFPQYAPGGDPFQGQPAQLNTARYLAGGLPFGPEIVSANITPRENGLPSGHTYPEFVGIMRRGATHHHKGVIQVMPWPEYAGMTDLDLRAIYEYLRAIPSIPEPPPPPP